MTRSVSSDDALTRLPRGTRVVCCCSSYHAELTGLMRDSALETLIEAGVAEEDLHEVRVPGAYELPVVAQRLARRDDVDAVLCFGLVLKGETDHDVHISSAVANGLMRAGLESEKPVLFGVLTCSTLEQARARARHRSEGGLDKGHEVARACVQALHALREAGGDLPRAGKQARREGVR